MPRADDFHFFKMRARTGRARDVVALSMCSVVFAGMFSSNSSQQPI